MRRWGPSPEETNMSHRNAKLVLIVLVTVSLACALSNTTPTSPPSPGPDLTSTAQEVAVVHGVETSFAATQAVQSAQSTAAASATRSAGETASAAFSLTATPARATETAAARLATRQANQTQAAVKATVQAQPMLDAVQKLVADGYLSKSDGTYRALDDFDESWAQLNWFQWTDTDYAPTDFVIRADAAWDSASTTADWWNSGCGFVFRKQDDGNYYVAYLGLDGWAYFFGYRKNVFVDLGGASYGKVDTPAGQAQLMLVVEGSKFTFIVNEQRVYSRIDKSFASGGLALTLLSGTNKGFGTRCHMTSIELWELK